MGSGKNRKRNRPKYKRKFVVSYISTNNKDNKSELHWSSKEYLYEFETEIDLINKIHKRIENNSYCNYNLYKYREIKI